MGPFAGDTNLGSVLKMSVAAITQANPALLDTSTVLAKDMEHTGDK